MTKLDYNIDGFVGGMLKKFLKERGLFNFSRVRLAHLERYSETRVISQGDFREDILEISRSLIERSRYKNRFKKDWDGKVRNMEGNSLVIKGRGDVSLRIGSLDLKRIAELAEGSWAPNPVYDNGGRQILSMEDFLLEFRGCMVDQILNQNKYGDPPKMVQAPTNLELGERVRNANQVYDHYMSIPIGSLMVTKDFIFPYIIGRKQFDDLRWGSGFGKYCGNSEKGARIPVAGASVHLTGVEIDCALHKFKNPVFRANFGFPMNVIGNTFVVPKEDERDYIENAVRSMDAFASIWVQNPPSEVGNDRNVNWCPNTEKDFIDTCKRHLRI